jgi:putative SOS response-associated peptidase YedK
MCGRFTLRTPTPVLLARFRLDTMPELAPRYNIAPTQLAPTVRVTVDAEREWAPLHWGLIPSWAKDPKIGSRMINARAETVAEKPAFRRAFRKRRCLVVADGYYEWRKVGREKQPHYIRMQDEQPFAMAGLWERWRGSAAARLDEPLDSCTVITTESNELTKDIHDRMPVILPEQHWDVWLDPELEEVTALQPLLQPYASAAMKMDLVSKYVNNARHEDARCIELQRELF